jgi:hypothetical protein
VRADGGAVSVTFLPQDARYAEYISEALASVVGVKEVRATMAETNILWIQERFDSTSEAFQEVVELATKWNAAVELLRLAPGGSERTELAEDTLDAPEPRASEGYNGGIEDDTEEAASDDGGMKGTLDALAACGRSGGGTVVSGEGHDLLESVDRSLSYSLVVVGDVFLNRGHAARIRMTRELQRFVSDHITAPVVGTDELKAEYLFGRRDVGRLIGFLTLVAAVYFLVFTNQEIVSKFLFGRWWDGSVVAKILVATTVLFFIPIVAHCYGTVAKSFMKLIKME